MESLRQALPNLFANPGNQLTALDRIYTDPLRANWNDVFGSWLAHVPPIAQRAGACWLQGMLKSIGCEARQDESIRRKARGARPTEACFLMR
ncbi:hypothetical protein BI364_08090 [Acidihalobacter yilgarnensis]|uniref:Uncharacterized protein n=1 Tax=Acidihalobacter yilgarnensis TaxID=2819280 RepID=A0A1D8IN80_9GAMM|nr:hypothetical protein BI364_08090 [Acidihalobacter yilgarnensis]